MNQLRIFWLFFFLIVHTTLTHGKEIKSGENIDNLLFKLVSKDSLNPKDGLDLSGYQHLKDPVLNLGFYDGGAWVKFPISKENKALLVIEHPILDKAILFKRQNGTLKEVDRIGDQLPFSDRKFPHRFPVINIADVDFEQDTAYLFVTNGGEQFYLPILSWDESGFDWFSQFDYPLFGGYFGIIIFAIFFNLFIALVFKERNIFTYVLYLISLFILQVSLNGFGGIWFWGDSIYWATHGNVIFASLSILFLLEFTLGFLFVRQYQPKVYYIIKVAQVLVGLNVLLSIFAGEDWLSLPILFINVVTFLFGVLIIPIAFVIYKKHFREARYFLLAFIFLIIGVFGFVLRNLGLVAPNFFSENGLQIGSSLEVILLTFAIIDKFKAFREQAINRLKQINDLREKANKELEQKVQERTADLEASNQTLLTQKNIIEEKNSEITESINYGEKIQSAMLPSAEEIFEKVSEGFILFKPKDIVSGDFYWVSHSEKYSFYVVADCTGHGVPGAFMSMIGSAFLSQIINKENYTDPALILDQLRLEIIGTLSKNNPAGAQKDGMDLALIRVDHVNKELCFAGANNPLYMVLQDPSGNPDLVQDLQSEKGILSVLPALKQPIGYQSEFDQPFFAQTILFNEGDQFYLFTDGYPDQFGGPKGKKIKYKQFKQLILNGSSEPMFAQKMALETFFESWISAENPANKEIFQVDDICILGLKM